MSLLSTLTMQTTLLDVLASRKTVGTISGEVSNHNHCASPTRS
jgi:hypothetical protein